MAPFRSFFPYDSSLPSVHQVILKSSQFSIIYLTVLQFSKQCWNSNPDQHEWTNRCWLHTQEEGSGHQQSSLMTMMVHHQRTQHIKDVREGMLEQRWHLMKICRPQWRKNNSWQTRQTSSTSSTCSAPNYGHITARHVICCRWRWSSHSTEGSGVCSHHWYCADRRWHISTHPAHLPHQPRVMWPVLPTRAKEEWRNRVSGTYEVCHAAVRPRCITSHFLHAHSPGMGYYFPHVFHWHWYGKGASLNKPGVWQTGIVHRWMML